MNLNDKRTKLAEIKSDFERNMGQNSRIEKTSSYFIGSKAHAEALQEALGGESYPTEYCHLAKGARELYAWEGPKRQEQCEEIHRRGYTSQPLDIEEIKMILF